ncbi:MAG: serine hydrolase [Pseudomonadota bacterium]
MQTTFKNWLIAGCVSLTITANAQVPFERPAGASGIEEVAAGYVALFTCSAYFIMNRPLSAITQEELVDLKAYEGLSPEIDETRQLVRVDSPNGYVAIAAHRPTLGCTVLPPHWSEADVGRLPNISMPDAPELSDVPFPQGDKARPRPNAKQRRLLDDAFDEKTYGEGNYTIGVAIVKDGKLVAERYREGFGIHTGYRTWSTAKSITSTLIGIAKRDGLIDIEAPANIPEWQYFQDPRQAITIKHLLHMSSGLHSYGANTNAIYFAGQDTISAATKTPLANVADGTAVPGELWKYANIDTLLLNRAIRATLNDDLRHLRYPYDELFHKIGMHHTRMEVDHLGNFIGSSQVYTTARDLARFGLLYLNDGIWDGERILPEGWAEFVAQPAPAYPATEGGMGYGAQFWLLGGFEGVPEGTYTSSGNKGQHATIVPSENLVIVRTGINPNGVRWDHPKFVADVVKTF